MARIRTVKPEFFRHEGLYESEIAFDLPLRVAFAGLWTSADREGRFKWNPRQLKLDCLPYDEVDFSRVLDALLTRGFLVKYASPDGQLYGSIPTWKKHQCINNKESASLLPSPEQSTICTRDERVDFALTSRGVKEGKGREGERKGKGTEGKTDSLDASLSSALTNAVFNAYARAYDRRYGVMPKRNAKVNGQLSQLVKRLGSEEAPEVAAYYLNHNNGYYVGRGHSVDCLLADAEKLRTEWATNRTTTQTQARMTDETQTRLNVWGPIIEEARRKKESENG